MSPPVLERKDVPKESTWNAESVFESWDAWQEAFEAVASEVSSLGKFSGRLSEGPSVLADWFDVLFGFYRKLSRVGIYAHMSSTVDMNDSVAKEKQVQISGLFGKVGATTAFAEPEMLEIGETLLEWVDQEPRLAIYKHYFDDLLREKAHVRSAEVEEILGMLHEPFSGVSRTATELTNTDLKFSDAVDGSGESHHVGQTTVPPTGIQSPDRELRRTAWEHFCDAHLAMKNTLASNYITHVKQQVFHVRVRGYDSVLESRLSPFNAPVEVFHNLIDVFQSNLSTWHRYWEVKRKLLGVETLHPYDIWAPIVEQEPEVDYQQAVDWLCEGMAPLGEDYVGVLRRGCLEERWVDYAENVGKRQGAAASATPETSPFVFMSYNNTLMAMSVLAHEMGHAMHGYRFNQVQPDVYKGMPGSMVAETPSNFNQALTRAYLMDIKGDDPTFQMALIDEAMFNFHRYFFIMPTLARFEWEVYSRAEADQPLSADILNEMMADLFAEGYGESLVDDPERTQITWAQFGHLYSPFYTFQYSIGISAAHALAVDVRNDVGDARQNYLAFLEAGSSRYAMDLFELAGVDMTSPEPVEKTFGVLSNLVDRLEKLAD
ncbi:MAG: oligoendopeptidase F [bacterium]|nr:oligoendopeptidase F [bacterium]